MNRRLRWVGAQAPIPRSKRDEAVGQAGAPHLKKRLDLVRVSALAAPGVSGRRYRGEIAPELAAWPQPWRDQFFLVRQRPVAAIMMAGLFGMQRRFVAVEQSIERALRLPAAANSALSGGLEKPQLERCAPVGLNPLARAAKLPSGAGVGGQLAQVEAAEKVQRRGLLCQEQLDLLEQFEQAQRTLLQEQQGRDYQEYLAVCRSGAHARLLGSGRYGRVRTVEEVDEQGQLKLRVVKEVRVTCERDLQRVLQEISILQQVQAAARAAAADCVVQLVGYQMPPLLPLRKTAVASGLYASIEMDLCAGGTLGDYLQRWGLDQPVYRLSEQLLEAVHFIHGANVAHLDLKLQNILLRASQRPATPRSVPALRPRADLQVVLADFGLAQDLKKNRWMSSAKGTLLYAHPGLLANQFDRVSAIDADWHAVGVVLYLMLFKQWPFHASSAHDVCQLKRQGVAVLAVQERVRRLEPGLREVEQADLAQFLCLMLNRCALHPCTGGVIYRPALGDGVILQHPGREVLQRLAQQEEAAEEMRNAP